MQRGRVSAITTDTAQWSNHVLLCGCLRGGMRTRSQPWNRRQGSRTLTQLRQLQRTDCLLQHKKQVR